MAATLFTTTELRYISEIRLVARRSESRAQQRRLRSPLPRGAVTEPGVAAFCLAGGRICRRAESVPPPAPQRRHSGGGGLELSGPHKNAQPGQPRRRLHRIRVFPQLAAASAAALKARASQPATAPLWLLLCAFRPTHKHPTQAVPRVSSVCRLACCLSVVLTQTHHNTLALAVRFWLCLKRRHCGVRAACSHLFPPGARLRFTLADRSILARCATGKEWRGLGNWRLSTPSASKFPFEAVCGEWSCLGYDSKTLQLNS